MKRSGRGGGGKGPPRHKALLRRSGHRPERARVLIVCEGKQTEPNYFRGLRDEVAVRQKFSVEVRKGKGGSCIAVVEQAVTEKEKAAARVEYFDEVWCVFDVEDASLREQAIDAQTLAAANEIQLALSNPAFECWLLAHFVRTKRSFADCDKVIEELNKHWRRLFKTDYEKNDDQLFTRLVNRSRTAIENGRVVREQDWASSPNIIDCNSASDVYRLVERLLGSSE